MLLPTLPTAPDHRCLQQVRHQEQAQVYLIDNIRKLCFICPAALTTKQPVHALTNLYYLDLSLAPLKTTLLEKYTLLITTQQISNH